jgi:hypothetical protein
VKVIRIAQRKLQDEGGPIMKDIKGKFPLHLIHGSEQDVKEDNPSQRAERVTLGPSPSRQPEVIRGWVYPCRQRVQILSQTVRGG